MILEKEILLVEALCGTKIPITHLDGRKLLLRTNKIIDPYSKRIIQGEGMPIKGSSKNGDLIVIFKIQFPSILGEERRTYLTKLLPKSSTQTYDLNEYQIKNMEFYEPYESSNHRNNEDIDINENHMENDGVGCATQ